MDELLDDAINNLYKKLSKLNFDKLLISEYNKRYLKSYLDDFSFIMPLYKQLMQKSLVKLKKPINESVFVDYGGGCGVLSFLALEMGFKNVIYNDIYEVSTTDVKLIEKEINYSIPHFVTGGIQELTDYLKTNKIAIDLCCSFNVLEHIYNLDEWFSTLKKIQNPFSLCFMTSANGSNPYINLKHKKIHNKAEFIGREKTKDWKDRDEYLSYFELRKKIIISNFPSVDNDQLFFLAKNTRGLYKSDILKFVKDYLETGVFAYKISHKTNTCDPITGNWAEHIINLKNFKSKFESNRFKVKFTNSYYSYSDNKLFNLPKYIINKIIYSINEENLFFSPTYTLEIDVKS